MLYVFPVIISFNFHCSFSDGSHQPHFADGKWSFRHFECVIHANKCQSTDFEPISLTPHQVLSPAIPLSNKEDLGEHSFLFSFLPSVLSPNIAHIVEWNSKEIEINSFLLKFLFFGAIPSSYVNHGSTSTSSLWPPPRIPFPKILSYLIWWITWFASRQKTTDTKHPIIVNSHMNKLNSRCIKAPKPWQENK